MNISDEELSYFNFFLKKKEEINDGASKGLSSGCITYLNRREVYGEFRHLFPQLKKNSAKYHFRISQEQFEELHILLYEEKNI